MNLSVVIPTCNRVEALAITLNHLERQRYPFDDFEVVVVDDGSQDATPELLSRERLLPLRWVSQPNAGTGAARNRAIEMAQGRHVVFVDDDVFTPPEFLARHAQALRDHPGCLIRGAVVNVPTSLSYPAPLPPLRFRWKHASRNYLCTSNASLRKDLLQLAGGFDPTFVRWEDAELGIRLKALGVRRWWHPDNHVYHWKPPQTLQQRCATAARDGQAAAQLYLRYPGWRTWLRSGLHALNGRRNRWLRNCSLLPRSWRDELEVERCYLQAGWAELHGRRA